MFNEKKTKHFKRYTLLLIPLVGLMMISLSNSHLFTRKYEVKISKALLENPVMCAPINRFDLDFQNSFVPVAPKLNTGGERSFPITTSSSEAQEFFDQGLFYMYAFNHAEAERSFKESARLDPDCAMCYWGISMALGPNINRPMPAEHMEDAYTYSRKALELKEPCSGKEKALIDALSLRYKKTPPANRKALDQSYADAMRIVAHRYREDGDIATLFSESLLDLIPWDYWLQDGSPKPETKEVHAVLDYVLEKDPAHPGANHYYIHSVEAFHPDLAEHCADKLKELEYPAGHLVHMPSHIFIRMGRYHEAAISNMKAVEVDEDYIEQCNAQGFYPALYYPHNIHFLWFAASMEGRSATSIEAARKLVTKVPEEMVAVEPRLQRFYAIPLFALARFGKWDEILKEPKPDDAYKYVQTMWHYARGLAFVHKGDISKAKKELAAVKKGMKNKTVKAIDSPGFPTLGMSKMAYHILLGEIEGLNNDKQRRIEQFKIAVDLQDGLRYTEPPFFYYPVRQSLGAALLEAGKPAEAEVVYRKALEKFPSNGWSLFGLQKSLKAQGKEKEAKEVHEQFEDAWVHSDIELE